MRLSFKIEGNAGSVGPDYACHILSGASQVHRPRARVQRGTVQPNVKACDVAVPTVGACGNSPEARIDGGTTHSGGGGGGGGGGLQTGRQTDHRRL